MHTYRHNPDKRSKHGKCEGESSPELCSNDVDSEAAHNHSDRHHSVDDASSQETWTDEPKKRFLTNEEIRIEVIVVAASFIHPSFEPHFDPCFAYVAFLVDGRSIPKAITIYVSKRIVNLAEWICHENFLNFGEE